MTALKPIEVKRATGQTASRYPLNMFCAHPECPEPAVDAHHIFPRSMIGNQLWFVQAWNGEDQEVFSSPLAHVTGLCRLHHDQVENHEAWIKIDEGESLDFVWYERVREADFGLEPDSTEEAWERIGALDPQPGGREKQHKPKKKRFRTDDELKRRRSVSLKLPVGFDGLDWRNLLDEAGEVELQQPDTPFDKGLGKIAAGKLVVTILERYAGRVPA